MMRRQIPLSSRAGLVTATLLLSAMLHPDSVLGQANPDSVKHRNDCRLASQVLTTGNPSTHSTWARTKIRTCDPDLLVSAATASLIRARSLSDRDAQIAAVAAASLIADERVAEALLSLAMDAAAPVIARVVSLRVLLMHVYFVVPPSLDDLMAGLDEDGTVRGCLRRSVHPRPWTETGRPPTQSQLDRIREEVRGLYADPSVPEPVRAAAYCFL